MTELLLRGWSDTAHFTRDSSHVSSPLCDLSFNLGMTKNRLLCAPPLMLLSFLKLLPFMLDSGLISRLVSVMSSATKQDLKGVREVICNKARFKRVEQRDDTFKNAVGEWLWQAQLEGCCAPGSSHETYSRIDTQHQSVIWLLSTLRLPSQSLIRSTPSVPPPDLRMTVLMTKLCTQCVEAGSEVYGRRLCVS